MFIEIVADQEADFDVFMQTIKELNDSDDIKFYHAKVQFQTELK